MAFDPNMMLGILFETHKQFTLAQPIAMYKIENSGKIEENLSHVFTNVETRELFAKNCLIKLNQLNLPRGTAHYGYNFWIDVALSCIKRDLHADYIKFPNGCCSLENCSINVLYKIVYDSLKSLTSTNI